MVLPGEVESASERENIASKLQREQVFAEVAVETCSEQIRLAMALKEALEENTRTYDAGIRENAQATKQKEAARQAAELASVKARIEEAARMTACRLQAAEDGLAMAQAEAAERIRRADQANQDALNRAQEIAKESEDLALAREAEAGRREEEARNRAGRHAKDTKDREAQRTCDAEQRAAALQDDAQKRAETMKQSAADLIDKYAKDLKEWMLRAEREMDVTKERVEMERKRAQQQAASVKSLATQFSGRAEQYVHDAEHAHVDSKGAAIKTKRDHEHWRAEEILWIADQADGLSGLEDLAQRLRNEAAALLEASPGSQA